MREDKLTFENPLELCTDDKDEAREFRVRVDLMLDIRDMIEGMGLNQTDAATRLGITQSRVSELVNGKFRNFTVDALLLYLRKLGADMAITIDSPFVRAEHHYPKRQLEPKLVIA